MRESGIRTRGKFFNESTKLLVYANDIDKIGRSTLDVTEDFVHIEEAPSNLGLQVNKGKLPFDILFLIETE